MLTRLAFSTIWQICLLLALKVKYWRPAGIRNTGLVPGIPEPETLRFSSDHFCFTINKCTCLIHILIKFVWVGINNVLELSRRYNCVVRIETLCCCNFYEVKKSDQADTPGSWRLEWLWINLTSRLENSAWRGKNRTQGWEASGTGRGIGLLERKAGDVLAVTTMAKECAIGPSGNREPWMTSELFLHSSCLLSPMGASLSHSLGKILPWCMCRIELMLLVFNLWCWMGEHPTVFRPRGGHLEAFSSNGRLGLCF